MKKKIGMTKKKMKTGKQPDGVISCFATVVAIRSPNINEVQHIGNTLIMVFDLSMQGIQVGTFISPYNPNVEIGDSFSVHLELNKIDRNKFLAAHGIKEIDNKMSEFIV